MTGVNQSNLAQLSAGDLDRVCADIANYGFTAVRFAANWGNLANFWGSVNYGPLVNVQRALAKHGLTPLPVVGCHYPWKHSPASFGAFTKRVVEIFGPLPAYEVWNEPNLKAFNIGTPKQFLGYLRAAAPHIRAVGSQVIHGGLAACPDHKFLWWPQDYSPENWLKGLYDAGEDNDYDLLGYHPYPLTEAGKFVSPTERPFPFGVGQIAAMNHIRYARRDYRLFSFTEVGYDTDRVSIDLVGEYFRHQHATLMNEGEPWVFCWRDTPGDFGNYGLVDAQNRPKQPYYSAVKELI